MIIYIYFLFCYLKCHSYNTSAKSAVLPVIVRRGKDIVCRYSIMGPEGTNMNINGNRNNDLSRYLTDCPKVEGLMITEGINNNIRPAPPSKSRAGLKVCRLLVG